jgi:APA family basic amino acid/polyamine antiporter
MFYAFSASSLITLRICEPHISRPFKVPFYPLPPLLVIFVAGVIMVSSLVTNPLYTCLALGFVSVSIPIHLIMEHYDKVSQSNPHSYTHSTEDFE